MKRKFFTNLLLILILNILVKPFWVFGVDRTVQNAVGTSEYGLYFSLFNFTLLFNIILDLGITNYNNRHLSFDASEIRNYLRHISIIRCFLGLVYMSLTFLIAWLLGYENRQFWLLFILVINQFLTSFLLYLRSNVSGMQFFSIDSFLSVLDKALIIVFCSLILWGHFISSPFKIEWFVYIQMVSYLISCVITWGIIRTKSEGYATRFQPTLMKKIIKESFPYAVLVFLMTLYTRSDSILLERLLPEGKLAAGIYAQSYRILDAFMMFAFLFPTLLLPMFSRQIGLKQNLKPLVTSAFSLLFFVSVGVSFSLSGYGKEIMPLLYSGAGLISSNVFQVLILAFIPVGITYIFGTLLTAQGMLTSLNYIALISVAISFILNFLLIPFYGVMGAAFSCLVTQMFNSSALLIVCHRKKLVEFTGREIRVYLFFLVLSGVLIFIATRFFPTLFLGILVSLVLTLLSGLFTGLVNLNKLREELRLYLANA